MSLISANILKSTLLGISVSVLFQNYNEKLDSYSQPTTPKKLPASLSRAFKIA